MCKDVKRYRKTHKKNLSSKNWKPKDSCKKVFNKSFVSLYFLIKIAFYLSLGLLKLKGRPSYMRSLHLSKEKKTSSTSKL